MTYYLADLECIKLIISKHLKRNPRMNHKELHRMFREIEYVCFDKERKETKLKAYKN